MDDSSFFLQNKLEAVLRILKDQNIDHNHQEIIPKFSKRRLFYTSVKWHW